jgi:gliding motility-associated-like protein
LLPTANSPIASFSVSNNDTIRLNLYQKPIIIYDIDPPGTTTSININGTVRLASEFPLSIPVFIDDLNTINPIIDPLFSFNSWQTNSNLLLNGGLPNNSFYGEYNDSVILNISQLSAFISNVSGVGVMNVCSNEEDSIKVYFSNGIAPYSFVYAINGVNQTAIPTSKNPHYIKVTETGTYTLTYFSDFISTSNVMNGSVEVVVTDKPTAIFSTDADTMSILYTTLKLQDLSEGNIVSWYWDFGDGTYSYDPNPYHSYDKQLGIYQISLIATDDRGCRDTTSKNIWISDDYWMYIPNSFTPDNDGINDLFCLTHHGIREATFHFNVYDRFSNLVYATEKIADLECFLNENGWDGKHYKTGNDLPMGAYIYQMYYQDFDGWKHQESSEIIIIR